MRIVIPSYGRAETLTTPQWLESGEGETPDYTVVVHTEEQRERYAEAGQVPEGRLAVSGTEPGLVNQRVWSDTEWADEGEWYLAMDDNLRGMTGLAEPWYWRSEVPVQDEDEWRGRFGHELTPRAFMGRAEETRQMALVTGARLAGFAHNDNYFFRGRKWQEPAFVYGKCWMTKAGTTGELFGADTIDDFARTASHLWRWGTTLINNWVRPRGAHYQPGGNGTYEKRLPRKIRDCAVLMEAWPGLFRYHDKAGCHPKAEIRLRPRTRETVERWRAKMRERRGAADRADD